MTRRMARPVLKRAANRFCADWPRRPALTRRPVLSWPAVDRNRYKRILVACTIAEIHLQSAVRLSDELRPLQLSRTACRDTSVIGTFTLAGRLQVLEITHLSPCRGPCRIAPKHY